MATMSRDDDLPDGDGEVYGTVTQTAHCSSTCTGPAGTLPVDVNVEGIHPWGAVVQSLACSRYPVILYIPESAKHGTVCKVNSLCILNSREMRGTRKHII